MSASKLRYTAYDAPPPASRLRPRRTSSVTSSRSGTLSDHSGINSVASDDAHTSDALSRTVTAGDLTLAAVSQNLETLSTVRYL